jgi:hypothetical protein
MTVHPMPEPIPANSTREQHRVHATARFEAFLHQNADATEALYAAEMASARTKIEVLFAATDDLLGLGDGPANATLVSAARFFVAGSPTSDDDLSIIAASADRTDRSRTKLRYIASHLDPFRVTWAADRRRPTPGERERAITWTAGLMAGAKCATDRKTKMGKVQEALTAGAVAAAGFKPGTYPLAPGEYCGEKEIGGAKADVVVRLPSGRHVLIECKASGSTTNSAKRGGHEVTDKPTKWRTALKDPNAIAVAVVGGAFGTNTLDAIETAGIHLFWDHALENLTEFLLKQRV